MSAAQHTPGPWQVERDRSISAPTPAGSPVVLSDVIVAEVRSGGCASLDQADANARLIAAAPDLLGALETARRAMQDAELAWCNGDPSPPAALLNALSDAQDAIAKATGGDA